MKVLDPGHEYTVDNIDGGEGSCSYLRFVKREGDQYPGNVGHYPGTNIQEVCRVLIDRIKYLDGQIPCVENLRALDSLRHVIYLMERRAAFRHHRSLSEEGVFWNIETKPTCKVCGHIECEEHNG
jgi:hypothetical protein